MQGDQLYFQRAYFNLTENKALFEGDENLSKVLPWSKLISNADRDFVIWKRKV